MNALAAQFVHEGLGDGERVRGGQRHRQQPGQHLASANWRKIREAECLPQGVELFIPGLEPSGVTGEGFRIGAKLVGDEA